MSEQPAAQEFDLDPEQVRAHLAGALEHLAQPAVPDDPAEVLDRAATALVELAEDLMAGLDVENLVESRAAREFPDPASIAVDQLATLAASAGTHGQVRLLERAWQLSGGPAAWLVWHAWHQVDPGAANAAPPF